MYPDGVYTVTANVVITYIVVAYILMACSHGLCSHGVCKTYTQVFYIYDLHRTFSSAKIIFALIFVRVQFSNLLQIHALVHGIME